MSWPHFLHGSEELILGVEGLSPDPEKHSFILDVDPVSTLTPHSIYAAKQQNIVQIVVLINYNYLFSTFSLCSVDLGNVLKN